jgi:cytochrome c
MQIPSKAAISTIVLVAMSAPSFAAGDAARGADVFNRCSICHSMAAGENGVGPSLHGIIGRKAGTEPNYNFSKAMTASGIVWDDAMLKKFLADPEAGVPGTKMHSGAVDDPRAIDDLIAYLKQAAK